MTNELLDAALSYARRGWHVFPLAARSKAPAIPRAHPKDDPLHGTCRGECGREGHGLYDATTDPERIRAWWTKYPIANVGIRAGVASHLAVVDVDPPDGEDTLDLLESMHGAFPKTATAVTGRNGMHYLFAIDEPLSGRNNGLGIHVDVKGDGGYIVAPPSIHDETGAEYIWLEETELAPLPEWVRTVLEQTRKGTASGMPSSSTRGPSALPPGSATPYARAALESEAAELAAMPKDSGRNNQLNNSALKVGRLVAGGQIDEPTVRAELHVACERNGLHAEDGWKACDDTISSGLKAGARDPKYPEVRAPARAPAMTTSSSTSSTSDAPPAGRVVDALADGFRGTDSGNAERFVAAADGHARFVHAWQRWIVYDEHAGVWRIDVGDALVTEKAKDVARRMFTLAPSLSGDARDALWKHAKKSESANAISSMIRLARGMDGVLVRHEQLDAEPWLLNVLNGTIDLRTGELRAHDPDDLLTVQAPTRYDPDADAPLWAACLERWQPDPTMREYLRQIIGTGTTGQAVEHLFINLGPGGNGKGKFYGAIAHVLGDYVVIPHKSLITVQKHEQHDTIKARLFGARLAIASETDANDRLDEAKVKDLTGGDLLEARRMREDPWKFRPTHTMVMHTNHRPTVRGVDEGVWRRIRLIPWNVTIPEGERDEHLAEKLEAEGSGILNWILAGVASWRAHGFTEPEDVRAATAGYRASQDTLAGFLDEFFVPVEGHRVATKDIVEAYERWCEATGETPVNKNVLGRMLTDRGFALTPDRRYRVGLRLLGPDDARIRAISPIPTRAYAREEPTGKSRDARIDQTSDLDGVGDDGLTDKERGWTLLS